MSPGLPLPTPSPEEQERSLDLVNVIRGEIRNAGGVIPFSRFMELALYDPRYGYYVAGLRKLGEGGDFVTAPELGDLFSSSLLNLIVPVLEQIGGGDILEFGAGSGVMAAQLLKAMEQRGALPERYLILDIGGELRHRQRDTIEAHAPDCAGRVRWVSEIPQAFKGVVLANEVVDALPVERFCVLDGKVQGVGVSWRDGAFEDRLYPFQDTVRDQISELAPAEGFRSEIGMHARAWMGTVCRALDEGVLLVVDYGYPASELYHPMRCDGTLMCHYRHRAHGDPYINVGTQDITSHVDFSALARSAHEAGRSVLGFTTQASFLLSLGLLELIESDQWEMNAESISRAQQVKRLTLPSEMGETFKALAVGSRVEIPLPGFSLSDQRHRLQTGI